MCGILVITNLLAISFCYKKSTQKQSAKQSIIEMSCAFVLSKAIHTAATLKIADELIDGSAHVEKLSKKLNANSSSLYRFMRFMVSYGIFKEVEPNVFGLTELAMPLLSQHPESLRLWLTGHDGYDKRWQAYGSMEYSVKTGKPAFNEIFGEGFFDFIAKAPEASKLFDSGMSNISAGEEETIVSDYDFSRYKKIIDVGGGVGRMLVQIAKKHPETLCKLYDLDHTINAAHEYLSNLNLLNRIKLEAGSFFNNIPRGADLYILKRILHDWDDEQCFTIF